MSLQQGISREFNESLLGREVDVLVDASFSEALTDDELAHLAQDIK